MAAIPVEWRPGQRQNRIKSSPDALALDSQMVCN